MTESSRMRAGTEEVGAKQKKRLLFSSLRKTIVIPIKKILKFQICFHYQDASKTFNHKLSAIFFRMVFAAWKTIVILVEKNLKFQFDFMKSISAS